MDMDDHTTYAPVEGFSTEGPVGDLNGVHPVNTEVSVIGLLRKDAEGVERPDPVYIPVKGYELSGLSIRYDFPDKPKELNLLVQKIERDFKDMYERNLYLSIDTMIKLCTGLFVQSSEAISESNPKGWVELDPDKTGTPIVLADTHKLGEIFGWDSEITSNTRQTVRKLFGNDLALGDHSARLQRWLVDTRSDVNSSLLSLGE